MARERDNDDLQPRDINLLPEDLRVQEDKARRAQTSKEQLYQMRTPKKEQRRRRFFSWLPFFGGEHWESPVRKDASAAPQPPSSAVRSEPAFGSTAPAPAPQPMQSGPGPIVVHPGAVSPRLSRKAPRSRFATFFARLFGRSKPATNLSAGGSYQTSGAPSASPRHYSLLPEKPAAEKQSAGVTIPSAPRPEPFGLPIPPIPVTSDGGGIKEVPGKRSVSAPEMTSRRIRSGFSLFDLIASWFSRRPHIPKSMTIRQGGRFSSDDRAAAMSTMRDNAVRAIDPNRLTTGIEKPREEAPRFDGSTPSITPVYSPSAKAPATRTKMQWHIPWWLDIFALFREAFRSGTPKARKMPRAIQDVPSMQKPAVPAPSVVPVTPVAPVTPAATVLPSSHSPIITPILDATKTAKPPRIKKQWNIPWWLDIFALFREAFRKGPHTSKPHAPKPIHITEEKKPIPVPQAPVAPAVDAATPTVPKFSPSIPIPPVAPIAPDVEPIQTFVRPPETPSVQPQQPQQPQTPKTMDGVISPVAIDQMSVLADETFNTDDRDKAEKGKWHIPNFKRDEKMPDASIVNLIPTRYETGRGWKGIGMSFGAAALSTVGVVAIIWFGLDIVERRILARTTEIDAKIFEFRDKYLPVYERTYEPRMTALGEQIEIIDQLLQKHIYWTNFFALLEKYTLPDVYYNGLSASTNGSLSLSAHGESYETVTKQLYLLQSDEAKEFVTDVQITGAQLSVTQDGGTDVSFTIGLTLNPNLFGYGGTE